MKKGDICLIEFAQFKGHEQIGLRPAIILSKETANLIVVVPMTSKLEALKYTCTLEINPSEKNGLKTKSVAMIFQLRAVDIRKIRKKIGEIEENILQKINLEIKELVNLK